MEIMQELYRPLVAQTFDPPPGVPRPAGMKQVPLLATALTSAEMIKYAANAFLAMKIGFANEIANICERVGAEAAEVMAGIGLDSRIGAKFLNPGVGWGGSCFGKDIHALLHTAREYGYDSKLLQASLEVNTAQRQMVIQKLQEKLFILKGRTIGLLGLAFKPDTDDLRDAPSLYIAERLLADGRTGESLRPDRHGCLPRSSGRDLKIRYCDSARELAEEADALVVVTEWSEFRDLDLAALAPLDGQADPGGRPQRVFTRSRGRRRLRLHRRGPKPPTAPRGSTSEGGGKSIAGIWNSVAVPEGLL